MKKSVTSYFISSVIIGSCIYLSSILGFVLPRIIRFYVNDFLIIPIVLTVLLYVVREAQNNRQKTISLFNILYLCLLYSLLFEFWLPKFHERYTYDIIDVCLYFLSGILFYFLQKEKNNNGVSRSY